MCANEGARKWRVLMKRIILLSLCTAAWSLTGCGDDDAVAIDSGLRDSGRDTGVRDSGSDTGPTDAGPTDAGPQDAGPPVTPSQAGDVVITEIMANADGFRDWFEVYNPSSTVTYNLKNCGLLDNVAALSTTNPHVIPVDVIIPPGGYVTFGESADPQKVGITPTYAYVTLVAGVEMRAFGIGADGEDPVIFCGSNNTVIDHVDFRGPGFMKEVRQDGGLPEVRLGASLSLDPDYRTASLNDVPSNWCYAQPIPANNYAPNVLLDGGADGGPGKPNYGTPGRANPECPE